MGMSRQQAGGHIIGMIILCLILVAPILFILCK
jgi:hypothetical protein